MRDAEPVVCIVDDDPAMRDALKLLLTAVGLEVALFRDAENFLTNHDTDRPGCVILDIRMPGMDGMTLQATLAARRIDIPIIFLTGHGDVRTAVRGMRNGAVNFLAKPFQKQELLDSITQALERDTAARKRRAHRAEVARRMALLSAREREVLDLVLAGYLNKQIARELGIAERTVEDHRRRIMEKTQAESIPDLARLVMTQPAPAPAERR